MTEPIIEDKPVRHLSKEAKAAESADEDRLKKALDALSNYDSTRPKKHSSDYFCPYTKNKKFELFVNDILELGLPKERTATEIVNFVRLIETFYFDRVQSLTYKCRFVEKSARKERSKTSVRVAEKHELE
mmetsp:Transcript_5823/g.9312  ORF Transcript_5823/g.9312 Transcript_5823/m.9312 type:complete len:130 (+) Transcript_5823:1107-1496(+)|eukprot:CAMPEP_0170501256 /NCGR_PEP_ID=MMETSP0208-20121228/37714_1 /TAXON_ID=197538 /ORGANISM="Strombidium inclinatum, Strain S3" /LENGTH=129 /DNA_ID=CAMNT_0010779695 /DNA_START=1032 /DNA_END=1421 /DNA_ORIENTATION=+